jgi:hypothetical protein
VISTGRNSNGKAIYLHIFSSVNKRALACKFESQLRNEGKLAEIPPLLAMVEAGGSSTEKVYKLSS